MPLQEQALEIPFVQGLESKSDPKLTDGTKLHALSNFELDGKGTPQTRTGMTILASNVTGTPRRMANRGNELLLVSGDNYPSLYTFSDAQDQMALIGKVPLAGIEKTSLVRNDAEQTYFDLAVASGKLLVAWKSASTTLTVRVLDISTGALLKETTLSTGAAIISTPRIFATGIVYVSAGSLLFSPLNSTTLSYGVAVTLRNNVNAAPQFDAIQLSAGTLLCSYRNSTPAIESLIINATTGATVTGPVVDGATDPSGSIGLAEFPNGTLLFAFGGTSGGAGTKLFTRTAGLAAPSFVSSMTASVANKIGICPSSENTSRVIVVYTLPAAGGVRVSTNVYEVDSTLFSSSALSGYYGQALAARPFRSGGETYIPLSQPSTQQSTFLLWKCRRSAAFGGSAETTDLVAYSMPGSQGGELDGSCPASVATTIDGRSVVLMLAREQGRFEVRSGKALTRKGIALLTFDAARAWNVVQLGGLAYFAGARPQRYDGQLALPMGFTIYPEDLTATDAAAGALSAGTYSWVAVLEYVDNTGVVHRSAPSTAVSLVLAAGRQVDIVVPRPADIDHFDGSIATNIRVYLYRTAANGSVAFNVFGAGAGSLFIAADSITIRDNVTDAALISNEVLYTTGGALEKMPLPPCRHLCVWQRRLFAVSTDADEIAYTSEVQQGDTIAPASNDAFRLYPPPVGGKLIATAVMDNSLIIFRERKTFVCQGQGPNALGLDATYTTPEPLPGDIGCTNPESVVETPMGVMFQSAKGIYLLDRSMQLQYVGAPVEAYNASSVVAAVAVEAKNQIRFSISGDRVLVYNYEFNQWAVFDVYPAGVMTNWKGTFVFADTEGHLIQDATASVAPVSDDPSYVLETSWLKVAGIAGFQRARWLTLLEELTFTPSGPAECDQVVDVFYDYESTSRETVTVSDVRTDASGVAQLSYRHRLKTQKCTALKIRVTATLVAANNPRLRLTGLRLGIAVKRGSMKIPSARTV